MPFKQQIEGMVSTYLDEQQPLKLDLSDHEDVLEEEDEAKIEDDSALDEIEDEGQEDNVNEDETRDGYESIDRDYNPNAY